MWFLKLIWEEDLLIAHDQKVVVGASLMRWLMVVKVRQLINGTAGECVPADTPTFKLVKVHNEGLEVKEIQPWRLWGASYL